MGRIAGERCRLVVVTDEDPRGEDRDGDPRRHRARRGGGRPAARPRPPASSPTGATAIEAAFERARPGDIVLLAGKGHERSIIGPDGPIAVGRTARESRGRPSRRDGYG